MDVTTLLTCSAKKSDRSSLAISFHFVFFLHFILYSLYTVTPSGKAVFQGPWKKFAFLELIPNNCILGKNISPNYKASI